MRLYFLHFSRNLNTLDDGSCALFYAALVWLMEMDGSDGLPAMRHIQTYIKGQR